MVWLFSRKRKEDEEKRKKRDQLGNELFGAILTEIQYFNFEFKDIHTKKQIREMKAEMIDVTDSYQIIVNLDSNRLIHVLINLNKPKSLEVILHDWGKIKGGVLELEYSDDNFEIFKTRIISYLKSLTKWAENKKI